MKKLTGKYGLPLEVKFCKKCVVSNQRPRIEFNEDGVCDPCTWKEMKASGKVDYKKLYKTIII